VDPRNSAFVRLVLPALEERRTQEIGDSIEQRLIGVLSTIPARGRVLGAQATDRDELLI
jgi:hypothetical protein